MLWGKFASTNQKHYPDLGSGMSSVWHFCWGTLSEIEPIQGQWMTRKWADRSNVSLFLLYFSLLNFPMPSNCKVLLYPSNHHASQSRLARSQMRRRTPVCSRACVLHVLMPGWLASERREQRNKLSKMLLRRNNLWINVEIHLLQTFVNITDYSSTLSKL